jgi:hypothetical protein
MEPWQTAPSGIGMRNAEEGTIREGEPRKWEGKGLKHTIRAPWVRRTRSARVGGAGGPSLRVRAEDLTKV